MKSRIASLVCTAFTFLVATLTTKSQSSGDGLDQPSPPSTPQQQNAMPPPAASTLAGETARSPQSFWNGSALTGTWGGFRSRLADNGITFTPVWTGELFGNAGGGMRRGLIEDGLFNVALDLDLGRMTHGGVNDLLIRANMLYIYGTGLSEKYVGDFSNTSNIAFYNSLRLDELWIQKSFWEKRLSVKVGNIAVDNEFFLSSTSSLFINGTFGAFTFIGANVANVPVYPLASPGVLVQFLPASSFYVMAGVFGQDRDENPEANAAHGNHLALSGDSGELVMTEEGWLLNQAPGQHGLQGTYKIGSWLDTGKHTTFAPQADDANGTGPLRGSGSNFGIYGVMDQQIFSQDGKVISLFVRSGGAPSNTNFVDCYVDGGLNFTGFIPGRDNDVAGVAVARSHVSRDYSDAQVAQMGSPLSAETVIEATYKLQICPWWSVQPDFQYIFTPGGVQGSRDAVVLGLRSSVAF